MTQYMPFKFVITNEKEAATLKGALHLKNVLSKSSKTKEVYIVLRDLICIRILIRLLI